MISCMQVYSSYPKMAAEYTLVWVINTQSSRHMVLTPCKMGIQAEELLYMSTLAAWAQIVVLRGGALQVVGMTEMYS